MQASEVVAGLAVNSLTPSGTSSISGAVRFRVARLSGFLHNYVLGAPTFMQRLP
jgi:hypothetical protein